MWCSHVRALMSIPLSLVLGIALPGCGDGGGGSQSFPPINQALRQDVLINADMWDTEPRMLAAGLGFTNIIGVPGLDVTQPEMSERLTRAAGGTWNTVAVPPGVVPGLGVYTSAVTPQGVLQTYGVAVTYADGLPVEFTWPLLPSTLDPEDFVVKLNTGERVTPRAAGITPNYDFNERAVAVLFGKFGNRFSPEDPRAVYPVRIEVVGDLKLVGVGGRIVSATGFGADAPGSPYTDPDVPPSERGGPKLVAAKLSRMDATGDQAPFLLGGLQNDGVSLYGDQAEYRLRVFTSGGFSPDGVRAIYPTEYSRYFRVVARADSGEFVYLTDADADYWVNGGRVRVIGLAELGAKQDSYDETYTEDQDNQIDIILSGDEVAIRSIVAVDVPSVEPYAPLYNPGGPGNNPTPGVRYSAPSAPHSVSVLMAIDDPMTVTYGDISLAQ